MFFSIVLAAAVAAPTFPECTPLQPLTPDQAAVGAAYDARHSFSRQPLTPEFVHLGGSGCRWERDDETEVQRVRRALSYGCEGNRTAIVGRVTGRRFLRSPEGYYVFGEYDVTVEERVTRIGRGDAIEPDAAIKVYRDGGTVCAPAGELRAANTDQTPLEIGRRYLLFLTPAAGTSGYTSSDFDWRLDDRAQRAQRAQLAHDHIDDAADVTAADLLAHMRTVATCK